MDATALQGSRWAATRTAVVALRTAGGVPGRRVPGAVRRRTAHARGAGTTNLGHRHGPDRWRCAPLPPSRSRWLRPTRPRHDPHRRTTGDDIDGTASARPGSVPTGPATAPATPPPIAVRPGPTHSLVRPATAPEPHPAAERALLHHTDQLTDSQPIDSHPFRVNSRADNSPATRAPGLTGCQYHRRSRGLSGCAAGSCGAPFLASGWVSQTNAAAVLWTH